ncbi:winged helix-turn-helix domain-containing protein [Caldimonas sp. KR1-144]|uniref:winged helix-turn-helix domain-containing protein n=1 Tax=Caldimonas sp. KR1-144 TaxID=3400911 RepID=UPI003C0451AE
MRSTDHMAGVVSHRSSVSAGTTASPSKFTFAGVELYVGAREVHVNGQVQRIEPRVFDVLLHLVTHRDRVVSRDELLRLFWKTEFVTESVVARCIMKARRVIGDTDAHAPLIKTVHGSGYRFVGAVKASSSHEVPVVAEPAPRRYGAGPPLRVAVLPFRNLTTLSELIWVEYGLAALLKRTLESHGNVVVTPILEVVAALDGKFEHLTTAQCADLVAEIAGVGAVVAVQVLSRDAGFELAYEVYHRTEVWRSGQVCDTDLTRMTIDLAQRLGHALSSGDPQPPSWPFTSDAFANEAFARAMQAIEEQRQLVGLRYIEVCVATEPHAFEMDVEHVAALAAVEHPETLLRAQAVLSRACEGGDIASQVRLLRALSSYHQSVGQYPQARDTINRALALLGGTQDEHLAASVLLQSAELALGDLDLDLALQLGRRVMQIARTVSSDRLTSHCLRIEGIASHLRGDSEHALEVLKRSAEMSRMLKLQHADLAQTQHRIALIHRDAGRLDAAIEAIDQAVANARHAGMPMRLAQALLVQMLVYTEAGDEANASKAMQQLESPQLESLRCGRLLSRLGWAWLSWRAGRLDDALRELDELRPLGRQFPPLWFGFGVGLNAGAAIAGRRFELARELIAEIESAPMYEHDTLLQGLAHFLHAALAHAFDRRAETWLLLRRAIAVAPPGLVRANACLAAVWLACEEGALSEVPEWLAQVSAWTEQHPSGVMALARYRYACGDWQQAAELQARYVGHWPAAEVTDLHRDWLAIYRRSATAGRSEPIPPLARLFTLRM